MSKSKNFIFDGGAATYVGTAILSKLITIISLGLAYPWALCLFHRWKAKHTYIEGRQLVFTGGGFSLIGFWIKSVILVIITLGIYLFWLTPRINQWVVEHTDFVDA